MPEAEPLQMDLATSPDLGLKFRSMVAEEEVSRLFEFQVVAVSEDVSIAADDRAAGDRGSGQQGSGLTFCLPDGFFEAVNSPSAFDVGSSFAFGFEQQRRSLLRTCRAAT